VNAAVDVYGFIFAVLLFTGGPLAGIVMILSRKPKGVGRSLVTVNVVPSQDAKARIRKTHWIDRWGLGATVVIDSVARSARVAGV